MKIKQTSSKRTVLIILAIAAVVIAGLSVYVFGMNGSLLGWKFRQDQTTDGVNLNPPTEEEKQEGNKAKQQALESDKSGRVDTPPATAPSTLPVYISSASQSTDSFQVRVVISAFVENGECTLTMSNNGQVVTQSAATRKDAHASICLGFDVPMSELSPGQWNIAVEVKSGENTGKATTTAEIK